MIKKPMKIIGKACACLILIFFIISMASWNISTIYDEVTYSSTSATLGRMETLISMGRYNELREQLSWTRKSYAPAYDAMWEVVDAYDLVCEYEMYQTAAANQDTVSESGEAYLRQAAEARSALQKVCEESTFEENGKTLRYFLKRVGTSESPSK